MGSEGSVARGTFDPKSVTPSQGVREFPDEQLTVSAGKLSCQACREELSTKISVLKNHINGYSFPPSIGWIAGTYTSTAHFFTCSVLHYAIIHLFFVRCAKFHSAEKFLLYL